MQVSSTLKLTHSLTHSFTILLMLSKPWIFRRVARLHTRRLSDAVSTQKLQEQEIERYCTTALLTHSHTYSHAHSFIHLLTHVLTHSLRKFPCTPSLEAHIKTLANHSIATTFTDTYYDTHSLDLTTRDIWLRQRDHIFELKSPIVPFNKMAIFSEKNHNNTTKNTSKTSTKTMNGIDNYCEDRDWNEIIHKISTQTCIQLNQNPNDLVTNDLMAIREWLLGNGLVPFTTIITHRKRYHVAVDLKVSESPTLLNIDIDTVQFMKNNDSTNVEKVCDLKETDSWNYVIGEVELCNPETVDEACVVMKQSFDFLGIPCAPVRGKVLEYLYRHAPQHYSALERSGLIQSKLQ